jgi:hypothetical protein
MADEPKDQPKGGDNLQVNNNNPANPGGTDPKKTSTDNQGAFDPSKIGDEDFDKIFDDPRVWKHPRFSKLNERAKKADQFEEQQQKEKEAKLLEEKKYQELIAEKDKQIAALAEKQKGSQLEGKIQSIAQTNGVVDVEAVLKLIDRTNIKFNDDGTITGVEEAVKSLLESKPYLKGTNNKIIGGGSNPGEQPGSARKFKLSELQDARFYRENNKNGEVDKAFKLGLVENDLPQNQGR